MVSDKSLLSSFGSWFVFPDHGRSVLVVETVSAVMVSGESVARHSFNVLYMGRCLAGWDSFFEWPFGPSCGSAIY